MRTCLFIDCREVGDGELPLPLLQQQSHCQVATVDVRVDPCTMEQFPQTRRQIKWFKLFNYEFGSNIWSHRISIWKCDWIWIWVNPTSHFAYSIKIDNVDLNVKYEHLQFCQWATALCNAAINIIIDGRKLACAHTQNGFSYNIYMRRFGHKFYCEVCMWTSMQECVFRNCVYFSATLTNGNAINWSVWL